MSRLTTDAARDRYWRDLVLEIAALEAPTTTPDELTAIVAYAAVEERPMSLTTARGHAAGAVDALIREGRL